MIRFLSGCLVLLFVVLMYAYSYGTARSRIPDVIRAAEAQGLRDVHIVGTTAPFAMFAGCDQNDLIAVEGKAIGVNRKPVRFVGCAGVLFKAITIRYK